MKRTDRALLLAMGLGDGYLRMQSKMSAEMSLCHSPRQEGYLRLKASMINSILSIDKPIKRVDRRDGTKRVRYTAYHKKLKPIYNLLYVGGRKKITKRLLNQFNDACVAIWWMDDGTISSRKVPTKPNPQSGYIPKNPYRIKSWEGSIATYIGMDELDVCIEFFQENYGITPKPIPRKQKDGSVKYSLRFNTGDLRILIPRIKPFASPDLLYKFPDIITG